MLGSQYCDDFSREELLAIYFGYVLCGEEWVKRILRGCSTRAVVVKGNSGVSSAKLQVRPNAPFCRSLGIVVIEESES